MKQIKKLFMVIFAITMTTSVCAQADWVGKWTGKGSKNINATLHLFSDSTFFYSFTVTLSNSHRNWDGSYWDAKYNMWAMYQGTWKGTQDNLLLKVDKSSSDGDIIQAHGLNNWDRLSLIQSSASSFEDVRKFDFDVISRKGNTVAVDWNDMTMTKTNVSKPYEFVPPTAGKFKKIWKNDWTYEMYGIYTAPNGNTTIGYWNLDAQPISEKSAVIAKTYDKSGKELSTKGDDESRLHVISNEADELFRTPVSGSHEFAYNDGRQYKGMWSNHLPDGQGVMSYPNGEKKEGTWEKGKFIEGTVVKKDDFWGTYIGEYKDEKFNGQGRLESVRDDPRTVGRIRDGLWKDGEFIEGTIIETHYEWEVNKDDTLVFEYKDGKKSNKGKYIHYNGSWEEGEFNDSYPYKIISGKAYIINDDGSTYTGEVKDRKREGIGTYKKGDLVLTGTWANDAIQQGKITCPEYTYEGTFSNGKFAEGTYVQGNMILTGTWKNQTFQQGDFNFKDGINGRSVKSAQGKYSDNDIQEVNMVTDKLKISGVKSYYFFECTITFPNNEQYVGCYSNLDMALAKTGCEYKWADGTTATGIVNNKYQPTKLSYTNSAGEKMKGKAIKKYEMQFPNGSSLNLPYDIGKSYDEMVQFLKKQISVPEISASLYK